MELCSLYQKKTTSNIVMGGCWCKRKNEESETYFPRTPQVVNLEQREARTISSIPTEYYLEGVDKTNCSDAVTVDKLILDTLGVIGTLVDK